MSDTTRYCRTPTGFLMVLRQSDDVLPHLAQLMQDKSLPCASFTGFGFAGMARFGFFDFDLKKYAPREFRDIELTSLVGTMAWSKGRPSIHAHAAGGDSHFNVVGGHLLSLEVGRGSIEITITVHDRRLERVKDEELGANILRI